MRVDLPDGGWAELNSPDKVTERKRRPLLEAVDAVRAESEPSTVRMSELQDRLVIALTQAWSFGSEPTVEALLDMPVGVIEALRNAAAPMLPDLLPDFGVSPDPKATIDD